MPWKLHNTLRALQAAKAFYANAQIGATTLAAFGASLLSFACLLPIEARWTLRPLCASSDRSLSARCTEPSARVRSVRQNFERQTSACCYPAFPGSIAPHDAGAEGVD